MRPLVTALVVLIFAGELNASLKKKVEEDEVSATSVEKRDSDSTENFNSFIEQKLMQQSQALEHLIKEVDNSGDMIKKLINNLSKGMEKPKLPTKAEVEELGSRRSIGGYPVTKQDQKTGDDKDSNKVNPWCPMALLCQQTVNPVCGYDDDFGYGKFEDFCHMLRVNCYWNYNFSIVLSCQPKL